ncbi:MAG: hypothetical protein ABIS47_03465, partial [Acidimicrobiales bacterium]
MALPWHLRPAAAALFDGLAPPLPALVVEGAMARLAARAAALVADRAAGTEITVDAFRVRAAAGCPAATVAEAEGSFTWTPATAARTLGLRAVAYHLRGDGRDGVPVEAAVEVVVADLMRAGGERTPGPWLAGLGPAGRAVAVAGARRWAEQALAWLPLRLVRRRQLRFLDDDWWRPQSGGAATHRARADAPAPGRRLVVHGRRDLTIGAAGARVAVTVAGGAASGPGLADVDALTALA